MLENGLLLTELLNLSNIISSKSEGRRMIEQNGISENGTKENDVNKLITTTDFNNNELII
jgi:tyrosyl-tRNA synthetase